MKADSSAVGQSFKGAVAVTSHPNESLNNLTAAPKNKVSTERAAIKRYQISLSVKK